MELETPVEESGYDQWLEQTSTRQLGRQDRIHGAAGVMPTPLWIALFFISLIVLGFILTFADSGERAVVQALYMGGTLATIMAMLLLLNFLDDPVRSGVGGLQPTAMERSLVLMDESLDAVGVEVTVPVRRGRTPAAVTAPVPPPAAERDWVEIVATVLLVGRGGGHRVEQLPGGPVERRAGQDGEPGERDAASRRRARRAWPRPRPRSTWRRSSSGWTPARTTTSSCKDFYEERFRDEFKPAFEAWLATDPLVTAGAPPTPFAMDEYQLEAAEEAKELDAEAEVLAAQVRRNIQRSTNYVLGVMLFAVSLFFAGMSTKLEGAARGSRCS